MKEIPKYIGFLVFLALALGLGYLGGLSQQEEAPLPTIQEIQERVGAVPDGRLGPETQEKWDRAVNNQWYEKVVGRMPK